MSSSVKEKILVRGVNWVGDAVMSMPALNALRKARPEAHIALLVKSSVAGLFEADPNVDEIILYRPEHKGILGRLRLASMLRKKGFSTAILFQNAFDAALIAFLARIPKRVGYDRDARRLLLTHPIPSDREDRKVHHVDYYLQLLRQAGMEAVRSEPWIFLTISERLEARQTLSSMNRPIVGMNRPIVGMNRPIIGINPGAAYGGAKRWPPGRFAEVAQMAAEQLGATSVLFGAETDRAVADEVMAKYSGPEGKLVSLAGETTLRGLAALVAECDVLVTNDSGPMHIAYGVGTPLVALFGSTDPVLTGPPKQGAMVLKADLDCSPCFKRECPLGGDALPCMDGITAKEVFDATAGLIAGKKAVFFDRDGTLCEDAHFLNDWKDFKLFKDIDSLGLLKDAGYLLIGVSNQSGIGRGLVREDFVKEVNRLFVEKHGFVDFYYCPHYPAEHCSCRKPEPGMIVRARNSLFVDPRQSYVVGDRDVDMHFARASGARAVQVLTGQGTASEDADYVAPGLSDAVQWIINDGGI